MSIPSAVGNYGGRVIDNQQGVKQFFVSDANSNTWIYKKQNTGLQNNGLLILTPTNSKTQVLINNDLIVTGSIYNTSDERLKDNISTILEEEADKLLKIEPKRFTFKNDVSKRSHFGVLAQDVEKVFPNLVDNSLTGHKRVNYQEFTPLILAKLKNMQSDIDELKNLCYK